MKKRVIICTTGVLLATNLAVQAQDRAAGAETAPVPAMRVEKAVATNVDDYIRAEMEKQNIPGLALAVVRNGQIEKSGGYGWASIELKVPVRPDTVFQIQSITKTFTATAVLMLVEEGKIGMDDKITKYLPGLPPSWQEITVRHLITHTSGIEDFIGPNAKGNVNLGKDIKPDDVIAFLKDLPLKFQPGEQYSYSNTGYVLLGMIIRQVTGKDWGDFVKERILDPLGMRDTRVISLSDSGTNFASGYYCGGEKFQKGSFVAPTILAFANGGLLSTVLDLAKWDASLYTEKILKRSTLDQMWVKAKLNNGSDSSKSLCWNVGDYRGHRLISATGSHNTGFMAAMGRFVDDKLTVIVLLNTSTAKQNGYDIVKGVAAFYIPGLNQPAGSK